MKICFRPTYVVTLYTGRLSRSLSLCIAIDTWNTYYNTYSQRVDARLSTALLCVMSGRTLFGDYYPRPYRCATDIFFFLLFFARGQT